MRCGGSGACATQLAQAGWCGAEPCHASAKSRCGAGQTSLELAHAVGAAGSVLGVDLSKPLLDIARRRAAGVDGLDVTQGDAQTLLFEEGAFDAAFSRFGVMFFEDPTAAFTNIRSALKPGGRLSFVCWRKGDDRNPHYQNDYGREPCLIRAARRF